MDFEERAKFYKKSVLLLGLDMAFYVEDEEDKDFWEHLLAAYQFSFTRKFYHYTKDKLPSGSINRRKGKATVLNYLPYVDDALALCIDSDYDLLTKTNNPTIQDNIFQTYTHSIENYKSYAPSLMNLCLAATHSTDYQLFDIEKFLSDYSEIIYPLFVVFIISESKANSGADRFLIGQKFEETAVLRGDFDIKDNGKAELENLKDRIKIQLDRLGTSYTSEEFQATELHIKTFGVTPQNTYLFFRGHSLYDAVTMPVIRSVSKILKNNELKKIRPNVQPYLDLCKDKDIANLLKENKNYHSCPLMNKIQADITAF